MPGRFRQRDLFKLYSSGLPACVPDEGREREFNASLRPVREAVPGLAAKPGSRLADVLGTDEPPPRVLLWRTVYKFDPGVWTAEPQTEPDCTSHANRTAVDTTRIGDILRRGDAEAFFARSATETTYGDRGHRGGGMSPERACRVTQEKGYLGRIKYSDDLDLRKYNGRLGANWGRRGTPASVWKYADGRHILEWVRPENPEIARRLVAAHCGSAFGFYFGWQRDSDSRGLIIPGPKPWNHAMAVGGYDFTREFYPCDVWFIPQTWGRWNNKPKFWPEEAYGPWPPGLSVMPNEIFVNECFTSSYRVALGAVGYQAPKLGGFGFDY